MPEQVFRDVLPLLWLCLVGGIAANRWYVRRRIGRDPVLIQPVRRPGPEGHLERVLVACVLTLTADIVMNARNPEMVAASLGFRAIRDSGWVGYVGLGMLASAALLGAVAILQMGLSWRIGIDTTAPGPLVSRGVYARIRHPIYSAMLLATTGTAAITADALSIAVAAAALVAVPMQARLEEAFLLSRYPEEYSSYVERKGRFWPRGR